MVRETRHLWVGNLPENIREERIREHFKRYGRVQSVKLLPGSNGSLCAAVAFMDIKSASKAHNCEHTLDEHALSTEYYEPGPYTSSQQRFPIGIADDHSTFERTSHFYERGASAPGTPLATAGTRSEVDGYLRRSSVYHTPPDPLRGRPRDRPYRNGPPYPPGTERSSCSNNRRNWVYDTGAVRYLSSSEDHGTGKSKKVRSGSESRSGSQSSRSRSPTRSTTGSPRSPDSSTRSDSPRSTRVSVQSAVAPPSQQTSSSTLAVYSEDRRPLAICVRNLPTRSSDTSLKDGLFHEYKKHGKVTWVKVVGAANERYALVCFKKPEDVEKAIEVSQDKLFFGCKIDVAPYHGYDVEDNEARPYDTELDEYHPKATRTLFIGNLEKDVTAGDIRQHFDQFGEIIEIDIKKQPGVTSSYAFCQYADIGSVVQAMRTLDGEPLGESRLKLGFGKSMASSCVWIAGVAEQVSDKYLDLQFRKFGPVSHVVVDRERGQALIFYEQVSAAAAAVKEMRGVPLRGNRIQIDFASRECQEAFYERIDVQGRDNTWSSFESSRSERDMLCSRYDSSRFRYDPARVRSSSYSRSSGGRTPRRHEVYESPRYKSYEELSPNSDHDDYPASEAPDLRHLHKERNHLQHLLDQLDRPLRSVTAADQGLVVTTHNHRRRLSSHQRSSGEGPAPLCKRRKTGSTSEDERRKHHHHHSGDESRPGTPLFDEKPDNVQPQEPRRVPRERPEEPLSLPLPQFAAQCFSNAKSSCTPTTLPHSTTPVQQAPPASPVRPPSPSSTTSSSEISPQSPTLEERIRSLDEKYEKWTGRTLQPPTKPKHRLLDVDVRELQPSDIVKSVLAKPSVFDEDSKRLENFGEKYEPRDFSSYPRSVGLEVQRFVPGDPRNPSYISNLSVKVSPLNSPSGVLLSPCPAAKGLQYPFPSHPPVQPTTSVATTTAGSSPPPSSVVRPISKSVEFSVQKAESWLGISKITDSSSSSTSSSQKDPLISSGFAQRFNVHPKPPSEPPTPRHNVMKLTDLVTQKIDIPAQKSVDPRLDKSSSVTTVTTSVLSQRVAVKSNEPVETNKNDINPHEFSTEGSSINNINNNNSNNSIINTNINNKVSTNSGSVSSSSSINNYVNNNTASNSSNSNNNNNNDSNCNRNGGVECGVNVNLNVNGDVTNGRKENVADPGGNRPNSECPAKAVEAGNKTPVAEVAGGEKSVAATDNSVSYSMETRISNKNSKVDSENASIFSSDKPSVENKELTEGNTIQNCESTKKLESSLLKSNVSHSKTANVILAESEGLPRSLPNQEAVVKLDGAKTNAGNGSSLKTCETVSKISENSVKLLGENDKLIINKSGSVHKDEFVPFNVRDKESGAESNEKVKKEKSSSSGRDERNGREVEKEKTREKAPSEKDSREKSDKTNVRQKDREMAESVDKERKKDREVESEKKKDRDSMEVIEREKRKESDSEKERRKDQVDVLDRRKEGSEKKSQDGIEKVKKKEEERDKEKEKEKRKDRESSEKRKESHSSERHKKSSDEKKREVEKKDKIGSQPASIGSKRRISSQDSVEGSEDAKRAKTEQKRRDSKESKSSYNSLSSSGSNNKIIKVDQKPQELKSSTDSKHKSSSEMSSAQKSSSSSSDSKSQEYKRKEDSERKKCQSESGEKKKDMKKIQVKLEDVLKSVNDYNGKSEKGDGSEEKKHSHTKKESKEKKRGSKQEFGSTESLEEKKVQRKEKRNSGEKKKEEETSEGKRTKEKTSKNETKKENGHETETDSDSEPKKHSIFDVVLDEPAYISMYDKVKARSCKNMQKQEEEKRQVKLKEKFSQLKQSRAKREKKRSTSWDEDSDSDASQIRRIPRRSFSRLSSEDEGVNKREKKTSESWDSDNRRSKKSYDTSEDEAVKVKNVLHMSDVYSDESDGGFAENGEKLNRKFNSKNKSKPVFESSEEESVKRPASVTKENFHSTPKPEKISLDCKNKVRLSLDSSTDRFCYESKNKKRTLTESMSEGEPSYHSAKSTEKVERKKSKKKEKRQKSVEDDSKSVEGDFVFVEKTESETKPSKSDKERRKSVHSNSEDHDESLRQKKNKSLKGSSHYEAVPKKEENKYDEMFDEFSDDSNDHQMTVKSETANAKGNTSKWQVAQVYGTDSDSNVDASEHVSASIGKQRKSKDKKKRDKKVREPSEELLEAGRALEKMLSSPPSRRESEDMLKYCDSAEDFGEDRPKVNKEKKKKRKKSKDEKSSRHHHHHHHHNFSEKTEPGVPADTKSGVTCSVTVAHISPSLPSLLDMPTSPSSVKQEPSSPMSPRVAPPPKNPEKIIPGFGYEMDEKIHESAVQSIAMLDVPKIKPKIEGEEALEETPPIKKEETKERTVISQEETEDAVAALLGETFTYSSCFEGNSPVDTDPEPHDEEEMRQAVQSLNEGKPDTPQSESGLQIDTDADEPEENFTGLRFDSLPRTPDLDLSQPPKTPDIQPSYVVEAKPVAFARKDTIRNSREDMEIPIVGPASPEPLSYQNAETETKKDIDLKPPILKPASPKHYKDEPPTIEPISTISSAERIFVDNRLLLHPPPLVPVAKQISVATPKSSPSLSIVRPMISLSSTTTPTLVLTPIRTTNPLGVTHSTAALPRKTFTLSTTTSSIITTRTSIQPPILSPVTPSLTSPVRLSPPCTETSVGSLTPRFATSATVVTSQQLPAHLIPQKIILHQVARSTPSRLVSAPGSVVKVLDSSAVNVSKAPASEMPALTLPEPVNTSQGTLTTMATPPPALGPAVSQGSAAASAAPLDMSRQEMPQPASVISVLPRSLPVSSQGYSRITTGGGVIESSPAPHFTTASLPSSSTTSVISVHTNVVDAKGALPNCPQIIHHGVVTTPKIVSYSSALPNALPPPPPEKPAPETTPVEVEKTIPCSPRQTSVIEPKVCEESKPLDLQVTEVVENRPPEKERPEEEKRTNFKKEIIEQIAGAAMEVKQKEAEDHPLQPAEHHENFYKNAPLEIIEQNESVIKKVDSLSSLKSEESVNENVDACDKSDTSSINQDESLRLLSSEEENKQVHSVITRKGRKKGTRGVAGRRGKCGNRMETVGGKRGGKAQRGGKMANDLGKKQSKDVYEFHDESDEDGSGEKERPRLILTIKSPNSVKEQPAVAGKSAAAASKSPNAAKSPKEGGVPVKSPEQKPVAFEKDLGTMNTRKSRRLLEKDGFRNTVDDIIEDVVRNGGNRKATSPRRSLRQVTKPAAVLPAKKIATRTMKKSIGCISTEEELKEGDVGVVMKTPESVYPEEKEVAPAPKTHQTNKEEHEGEGETSDEEPTTLIDPVTGMLMVMRAKEEGKYVPVPNVPPIAPPTPPPPPAKADVLPIVTEGLASHWLTHETLKQAVIKVQTYGEPNKVNPVFMSRPPTPPTTPQARIQEPVTRLPVEIIKKVTAEQMLEPETAKPEQILLQPMELSKQKICHMEQGKIYPEINRVEYGDANRNAIPESGKVLRQIAKTQPPPVVNKSLSAKGVAILASPNKQLYQNPKHIKMSPQNQILTGAVASSPPRVVKTTPPAHELHPLTGAVASPPPRAPHLTSQQPVVTGASSSRALVDAPKGPGASPRGMTIPPYEATLQTPTQNLHSPPPAHQQGEGINMGHLGHPPFVHPQLMYQQYLRAQEMLPSPYQLTASLQGKLEERERERGAGDMGRSPPLELRSQRATDSPTVYMGRQQYTRYYEDPPPAHLHAGRHIHQAPDAPGQPRLQIATPPHASQVPPQADSLLMLLQRYPIMWQGLLALKNDQSAVQMHFVFGNPHVARDSLPCNSDGSTPPLRIAQRMRLEQTQLEGVARKMQMDNEHCMLLALPCGRDHMDVLQQSTNLQTGFITYLQQKQAAGIVNIAHPGSQQAAYVVHIFPSCEFANENLARNAPDLLHRMQEIPHLVIVIATV